MQYAMAMVLGLTGSAASGAPADRQPIVHFGVACGPRDAALCKDVGAQVVRPMPGFNAIWGIVESRGRFNFSRVDQKMREIRASGAEPMGLLSLTRQARRSQGIFRDEAAYRRYVRTTIAHYSGRPGAGPLVRYWRVGNEPSNPHQQVSPTQYAKVLRAAYEEVKRAAPGAQVVFAGLADDVLANRGDEAGEIGWFRKCLAAGAGKCFDIMDLHVYDHDTMHMVRRYQEVLAEHGLQDKPIWMTELGSSSASENVFVHGGGTPERQAMVLWRQYLKAFGAGVEVVMWLHVRDFPPHMPARSPHAKFRHHGLVDWNGRHKPAAAAYRTLVTLLGDFQTAKVLSEETGRVKVSDRAAGVMLIEFAFADGRQVWAAWSDSGQPLEFQSDVPLQSVGPDGRPASWPSKDGRVQVKLSAAPLLLYAASQ